MEHESLGSLISQCQEDSGAVAITGIGGIGYVDLKAIDLHLVSI